MSDWLWKNSIRLPVHEDTSFGSWMAPLMACICATDGPVLEIGAGDWSTPFLHHFCRCTGRRLLTLEEDKAWTEKYTHLRCEVHGIYVAQYHESIPRATQQYLTARTAENRELFGAALIDGSPSEVRARHCQLLQNYVQYLVVHDYSGKECQEIFTREVLDLWPYVAVAPRPRYSPSSLILGHRPIPHFDGVLHFKAAGTWFEAAVAAAAGVSG